MGLATSKRLFVAIPLFNVPLPTLEILAKVLSLWPDKNPRTLSAVRAANKEAYAAACLECNGGHNE